MATDARGVEITEGASCIYGAPVGRSIALVEGVIDGFTPSGRVWVRIVRRAYGRGWTDSKDRVHVGADRLVIVDALPESGLQTQAEKVAETRRQTAERYRQNIAHVKAGGDVPSYMGTREEALAWYRERLAALEDA
ncbi:hypothetical protein AB0E81_11275 [Streptomyces sp. NPDC033538]|uniref:hypothetical protein n=1 Tax=Streptomyces sp. NPDC033538 TaxID=3155367 RepID=UPI0033EEDF4C